MLHAPLESKVFKRAISRYTGLEQPHTVAEYGPRGDEMGKPCSMGNPGLHLRTAGTVSVLIILLLTTLGSAATEIPPLRWPRVPDNWEDAIDPRFDPQVEKSVIWFGRNLKSEEELADAWEAWGPEASERLEELLRTDEWGQYRPTIARVLVLAPFPAIHERIHDYLRECALSGAELDRNDLPCQAGTAFIENLAKYRSADSLPLLLQIAEEGTPGFRHDAVIQLRDYDDVEAQSAAAKNLAELEHSSDEEERAAALRLLRSGDPGEAEFERAYRLSKTIADGHPKWVKISWNRARDRWRADEPMADTEKEGSECFTD